MVLYHMLYNNTGEKTISCSISTEREYTFTKQCVDTDSYENETASFEVQVSDRDAKCVWFFKDKVV